MLLKYRFLPQTEINGTRFSKAAFPWVTFAIQNRPVRYKQHLSKLRASRVNMDNLIEFSLQAWSSFRSLGIIQVSLSKLIAV